MSAIERARDAVAQTAAAPGRPDIFREFERMRPAIERALPTTLGLTPEQFIRRAITLLRQTPALARCTRESLLGGLMLGAQLGIEFGPLGEGYLVPMFNKRIGAEEATFILGYKGIIKLARRSGELSRIEARVVYEHDDFDWCYGINAKLEHRPRLGDRGRPVAVYGLAVFHSGETFFEVLDIHEVDRHRQRSASRDRGPWVTDWEAMAKKTAIRVMAPYLPLSVEMAAVLRTDERVRTSLSDRMVDDEETLAVPEDVSQPAEAAPPPDEPSPPAAADPPARGEPPDGAVASPSEIASSEPAPSGTKLTKAQLREEQSRLDMQAANIAGMSPARMRLTVQHATGGVHRTVGELVTPDQILRLRTLLSDVESGRYVYTVDENGEEQLTLAQPEESLQGVLHKGPEDPGEEF